MELASLFVCYVTHSEWAQGNTHFAYLSGASKCME